MTVERVLAAAAVLREFGLAEISAFCDEQPPDIVTILDSAAPAVEPSGEERWRVVDLVAVRRAARRGMPAVVRSRLGPEDGPGARLQLAEETLTACRSEPSPDRRRVMVASAMNHLRQVLAATLPDRLPWWTVELGTDVLVHELRRHPDPVHAVRL